MKLKIINNSNLDSGIENMIQNLTVFAKDRFGFQKPPSFHLNSDSVNAQDTLGKTGYYDPNNMEIHVYVDGRHDKDILRSIAHELVHHWQNEQGFLTDQGYSGAGYAQKNPHLRNMEKEAYLKGNMCFRDWEDSYKETNYNQRGNIMSLKEWKNEKLNEKLMKKWFGVIKENNNIEEEVVEEEGELEEAVDEGSKSYKRDDELEESAKPDFPDLDDDGDKDEPIAQAAKDAEELEEAIFQEVMKTLKGK